MTSHADHAETPDGVGEHADAIRAVETEFLNMFSRFRHLMMRRANALSPGLMPGSFKVFTSIAHDGPITAAALAEQHMLDKGQISRTVGELERRELITRRPDPSDGRAQLLEALPEASERLEAIRSDPDERSMRDKLASWRIDDIRRLGVLLHALNEEPWRRTDASPE